MKILVTGGLGYIGSHTAVALQQAGFEVLIIDNMSNSSIEVLEESQKLPVYFQNLSSWIYVKKTTYLTF